jgi:hypothetical protein
MKTGQSDFIWFPKPDHPVSPGSRQKEASRTIMLGMAQAPCWYSPKLTLSQKRRIQRMRAQKMREEAVKKEREREEHFNTIWPVIPMKQERRVKEKASTPALMTSDDDMDLLDDNEFR